jgi:L-fuconolactonase
MITDAHQHYWQCVRGDYGWLAGAPQSLQRDFLPIDLASQRKASGVHASVLVQAAPTEAETRFLFQIAAQDTGVVGVVGWTDFEAKDVRARIANLVKDGGGLLVGFRPMVQDIADKDWLDRRTIDSAFDALEEHNLAFDALVTPVQYPALTRRLARQPTLQVVLDHGGKPDVAHNDYEIWAPQVDVLAKHVRLYCKFSGLLTQLAPQMPTHHLDPYVAKLFNCFGAERLIWGSDWPVVTSQGSYEQWLELSKSYTRLYASSSETSVFSGNAQRFYQFREGRSGPRS